MFSFRGCNSISISRPPNVLQPWHWWHSAAADSQLLVVAARWPGPTNNSRNWPRIRKIARIITYSMHISMYYITMKLVVGSKQTWHNQDISKGIKFVLGIGSAPRSRYQKIHHPKILQRKQTHSCTGTQPTRHTPLTIVALWHMRWLQHCVLPCPVMIFWSTWTTACLEKQRVTMHSPWKFPKVLILICFQLYLIESQSMLEK